MATTAKTTPTKPATKATPVKKPTTTAVKPAAAPAKTKVEPVEAAVKAGQETVETVVKTSTAVAKKGVEKAVAMQQDQVAAAVKAGNDAYKGYEDLVEFAKSNIDAFMKTNEILSAGMQEFNAKVMELTQANIEESVKTTQKLMQCTSVIEVFELQTEAAKKGFETTVAESRTLSTLSAKVAEDASKPLAERVNVTVETLAKPIAA